MNHPLDGSKLKVVRAQKHLSELKTEIRTYLDTCPYDIVPNVQKNSGYSGPYPVALAEPPIELSSIIGDVLNNLRPALDYVAWQLAVKYLGDPPLNPAKDKGWICYPIALSASDDGYWNKINRFTNRKLPTDAIAEIQSTQPHNRGYEAMGWLRDLVNDDKHRDPKLTLTHFPSFAYVAWGSGPNRNILYAPIGHHLSAESTATSNSEMKMDAKTPVFVALADETMPLEPVDVTLDKILKTVTDIIPRFERFF